jgi:hypothetical protein
VYKDSNLEITCFGAESTDDLFSPVIYSFFGEPAQLKGKFNPVLARELGCHPKKHFKILNEGRPVTLEDGTIIQPA